jgi:hypothetical protein
MQSITVKLLKEKLRKTFRDDFGIQWNDALLDEIIFEAQREYALHSGCLQGECDCVVNINGLFLLPEDFFQAIRIMDTSGRVIPIESYRVLVDKHGDFRAIRGDKARAVCFDFDSLKFMRVFPVLPDGAEIGKLFYKRLPHPGKFEVKNTSAVEQHALYQMFLFAGKQQAQVAYQSFLEMVYRDQTKKISSNNNSIARTGSFY